MKKQRALIFGITGQDGSYLAELLLEKGYEVWGSLRRSSTFNTSNIDHIFSRLNLRYADLTDPMSVDKLIQDAQPNEIYNLAAQSHVKTSFDIPDYTANTVALGSLRILESVKHSNIKVYQASSSEMFGSTPPPQNEDTPFHPRSPYGVSKVFAYHAAVNYRESYNMFVSNGILFNHESPRRGRTFVTRKISHAVAEIIRGRQKELILGNLSSRRDWGYAKEYVEAMWMMLQEDKPGDYVIATGETHTVQDFAMEAFDYVGLNWRDYVKTGPQYVRPAEVDVLLGDPSKANIELGWKAKTKFRELVHLMVEADLAK
jgi:GDPmannose 4,6-dehydratase